MARQSHAVVRSVGPELDARFETLIERRIRRLVVASSMSIYGEGAYVDEGGRSRAGCEGSRRSHADLVSRGGQYAALVRRQAL